MRCFFLLNGFSPKATAVAVTKQNLALVSGGVLLTFLRLDREEIHFPLHSFLTEETRRENTKKIRFSRFNQFLAIYGEM